mmetsp:Transcript_29029/g.29478  ORF Transcript_29029/g.29478 Transcript_29029/m.29478 type:complete len:95 (+) Transcript_29029:778-1062(+)
MSPRKALLFVLVCVCVFVYRYNMVSGKAEQEGGKEQKAKKKSQTMNLGLFICESFREREILSIICFIDDIYICPAYTQINQLEGPTKKTHITHQ